MEAALLEILAALKAGTTPLDDVWLDRLVRRHNRAAHDGTRRVAKRRLLPFYLQVRERDPERWRSWEVDEATEAQLLRLLRMKPRRTASGVATITVITKPWPCSSDCLYCPNDIRCPKSYLANEPACQRAEHNFYDPYLQVKARLHALDEMGHVTDKIELIVLGGTWSDYPAPYQRWFVRELFRALNDGEPYTGGPELPGPPCGGQAEARTAFYRDCGLSSDPSELRRAAEPLQQRVNAGELSYNAVIRQLMDSGPWRQVAALQEASWEEVEHAQKVNEDARHRVVGLVIETRPDLIDPEAARTMRRLGCTKIQMGIQSLDDELLAANQRRVTRAQIARAFAVLRTWGFKIHVHFMTNLLGATPRSDVSDYQLLVSDPRFCPDEVKLYPCSLVESARLMTAWCEGRWRPYREEELVGVLAADVCATPAYVRISRMIRDISSVDIVTGNRKTNLRQLVEARLANRAGSIREIRMREIAGADVNASELRLDDVCYQTTTAEEHFLQWVTADNHIAGFCRLSLPRPELDGAASDERPTPPRTAMIREVHIYGRVAGIGAGAQGAAQHAGLGRALVEEACRRAREAGYERIAVISSVGTRGYYRTLGFCDGELYQLRTLAAEGTAAAQPQPASGQADGGQA